MRAGDRAGRRRRRGELGVRVLPREGGPEPEARRHAARASTSSARGKTRRSRPSSRRSPSTRTATGPGARQGFGTVAGGGLTQDSTDRHDQEQAVPGPRGRQGEVVRAVRALPRTPLRIYREGLAKKDDKLLGGTASRRSTPTRPRARASLHATRRARAAGTPTRCCSRRRSSSRSKRYDEAAAAFDALYQKSLTGPDRRPLLLRGEARTRAGSPRRRATAMRRRPRTRPRPPPSRACSISPRTPAASASSAGTSTRPGCRRRAIMLRGRREGRLPPEFARVRTYLLTGTPDALRQKLAGKPAGRRRRGAGGRALPHGPGGRATTASGWRSSPRRSTLTPSSRSPTSASSTSR